MKLKAAFLIFILVICKSAFTQVGVSYSYSNVSHFGLGYYFDNNSWVEMDVSVPDSKEISLISIAYYGFNIDDKNLFYMGLGTDMIYYNDFYLPIGVQVTPLSKFKCFSFHFDIQPTIRHDKFTIQPSWGVRLYFGKQ